MGECGTKGSGYVLVKWVVSRLAMSADIPYVNEVIDCARMTKEDVLELSRRS